MTQGIARRRRTHAWRRPGYGRCAAGAVLMLVATLVAACNVALEQQYYREGIGTSIRNPDVVTVTELQNAYLAELCRQVDSPTSPSACDVPGFSPAWGLIVQAGMNDIDARCDAYLAWLDDKRRSQGPIASEINSLSTATQSIMRVTGVGANPITLVGVAFGLASDTFTNSRARLLLEVDHSTVQSIVLSRQQTYREGIARQAIDNRAAAIYALRSYLRLCMPMTIETQINSTVTIYEQGGADALKRKPPLIDPKTVGGVALRAPEPIRRSDRAPAAALPSSVAALFVTPTGVTLPYFKHIQAALCARQENGTVGTATRTQIQIFKESYDGASPGDQLNDREISEIFRYSCVEGQFLNYFEKRTYGDPRTGPPAVAQLAKALNLAQPENPLSPDLTTITAAARAKISAVRALSSIKPRLALPLPASFADQVTPDFLSALPRPPRETRQ